MSLCVRACIHGHAFHLPPFFLSIFFPVLLFTFDSARVCGVLVFVYHLFCCHVFPYVNTHTGATLDAWVYKNEWMYVRRVWLYMPVWVLNCFSVQLHLFTPSHTFICQKAQSQKACDSFTCQTRVLISSSRRLPVSSLFVTDNLKLLWLVLLLRPQWSKVGKLAGED